jgi:hypothetical protein
MCLQKTMDFGLTVILCAVAGCLFASSKTGRLVELVDREWPQQASARGQWLAKYDPLKLVLPVRDDFNPTVTVVLGLVYLSHYVWALCYLIYLLFKPATQKQQQHALVFAGRFLVANVFYLAVQVLYPVSPPWKFLRFCTRTEPATLFMREAGLARVDRAMNLNLFARLYAKNHWIDGAMPSGHVLWSALVTFDSDWAWLATAHTLLTTIGALHFAHHFLVDCVAGVFIAAAVVYNV